MKELSLTPSGLLPSNRPDNEGSGGGSPPIGTGAGVGGDLRSTRKDKKENLPIVFPPGLGGTGNGNPLDFNHTA